MKIPDSVADFGESVSVLNYRRKPAVWEDGTICGLGYTCPFGGAFKWSYRVRLARKSSGKGRGGRPIFVHVGDDAIRSHKSDRLRRERRENRRKSMSPDEKARHDLRLRKDQRK